MQLDPSPKVFNNYKCDYPENTIKRVEDRLKKIGLNHTYTQKEIVSKDFSSYYGELLIEELGFLTCGKGTTSILAKASAYAEMAERLSSGFFVFHTITNKIGERTKLLEGLIKREFLKGYTEATSDFTNLENINSYIEEKITKKEFELLKNQGLFDVFIDSYSFINDKYLKTPISFIEVISGSTGLAAGNTFEEAFVQGTCEIFERYSTFRILTNKIECPTIDINSIDDSAVQGFIEMFKSMNIDILIKDFSLNKKLPVICVIFTNKNIRDDENKLKKNLYYKMIDVGSHPDLNQAILRCFTERLQGVTKEEFMYRKKCDLIYDFWTKKLEKKFIQTKEVSKDFFIDYEACGDVAFLEKGKGISFKELKSEKNQDCLDDCKFLIDVCKKNSWDLQVIDYTHKILNFPALRIIIPLISTSHDPHILNSLKIDDFKERLDSLYGINNFFKYAVEDGWIKDKFEIEKLINNLENLLSKNPLNYRFFIRQGHFLYLLNLYHLLAFSNYATGNHEETLKYLDFLIELKDKPPFYSTQFNKLLNPGYNPDLFSKYKEEIISGLQNNNPAIFTFESNPFKQETIIEDMDSYFDKILVDLNKSYFS